MISKSVATVPIIHSMIDPDYVLNIVRERYDLKGADECRLLQTNSNDTYLVKTNSREKLVYRVYRANWRTLSDIVYEKDALLHLKERGVPVSYPLPDSDGEHIQEIDAPEGMRYGTLFSYARGNMLPLDGDNAPLFGRIAAEIHSATDDFTSTQTRTPLDFTQLYDTPLQVVRKWMAHRPEELAWAESVLERFRTSLNDEVLSSLDYGFCHGDLHGGNIHHEDGNYTVFDFDCGGPGWRAYDLACVWWVARMVKNERPILNPFLESYVKVKDLSQKDLDSIPAFLAMRHVWLFGFHATKKQHLGSGWVNDTYMSDWLRYLRTLEESADKADSLVIGALEPWYLPIQRNSIFRRAVQKLKRTLRL